MAIKKEALHKDLDELSSTISAQTRTLTLGVLAVAWLFLSKSKDAPDLAIVAHSTQLALIAALCVLSLGLDLLQYEVGYRNAHKKEEARNGADEVPNYDKKAFSYRVRGYLFTGKKVCLLVATVWLLILLAASVLGTHQASQGAPACSSSTPKASADGGNSGGNYRHGLLEI